VVSQTAYDQLGGFSSVRKLVSDFYDRVLEEESLAVFFKDTNMADLIDHQTKFWAFLLGGPASYTEEQLLKIHSSLNISDDHFDLILELAAETLEDNDVDGEQIAGIAAKLKSYRSTIVAGDEPGE
jgi:hemoglobin